MRAQIRPAPFQVLVVPYRPERNGLRYAILRRQANTGGYWQFIAGGGDVGETRAQAARREALEEGGVSPRSRFIRLDALAMIPVEHVSGFRWGPDVGCNSGILLRCPDAGCGDPTVTRAHRVPLGLLSIRDAPAALGQQSHRPMGVGSSSATRVGCSRRRVARTDDRGLQTFGIA